MPIYAYRCSRCHSPHDIAKPMSVSDMPEQCPRCGYLMRKDFAASMPRVHKDSYSKDLHSDALAIHPEQRAEHQQRYPDVPLDKENRPILSSFGQHERYMERRGIYKPPGRARRRMKKVS